jgi:hypothetical protein
MSKRKEKKHKFTPLNLPVSQDYIFQAKRTKMLFWGSLAGLLFLFYFLFDTVFQENTFIASGLLSSQHANFEKQCTTCHVAAESVSDALCSGCHEKTSELDIYDYKAHYLYRSNDFQRISRDSLHKYAAFELPCSACHMEHGGRKASIIQVTDEQCRQCHGFNSFNDGHPEFSFRRTLSADDSTLKMTHVRHTAFVLQAIKGIENIDVLIPTLQAESMDFIYFFEAACLYCHQPEPDGKKFKRIDFAQHCKACHIKADAIVAGLPKFDPADPGRPGVKTIRQLQAKSKPGLSWTFASNANLIVDENSEVSKNPLSHKDPWIMANLKQIQKTLFPGEGLYDLLLTYGSASVARQDTLYNEAIFTLQNYVNELNDRAELKAEIEKINSLLKIARGKLQRPSAKRTLSIFRSPSEMPDNTLSAARQAGWLQLAFDLTETTGPQCQKCHLVENAAIARVQSDQDVLIRAEFDHRAHILEKRCTECHRNIPMDAKRLKSSTANYSDFKQRFPETFQADKAVTMNIPAIKSCQECHADGKTDNRCITCHKFHPNQNRRSNLQLFVRR